MTMINNKWKANLIQMMIIYLQKTLEMPDMVLVIKSIFNGNN